jgi:hypothetical protein
LLFSLALDETCFWLYFLLYNMVVNRITATWVALNVIKISAFPLENVHISSFSENVQ